MAIRVSEVAGPRRRFSFALARVFSTGTHWPRTMMIAALALVVVYPVTMRLEGVADASTLSGMLYGTVATLLMIGAALYGVRRRTMRLGLGRARTWQQFHLYGGTVFLLATLLHAGFSWPKGSLSAWLLGLSLWVFVSGLIGLGIQQWVQRLLRPLKTEVLFERIPDLVVHLREQSQALAEASSVMVRDFYRTDLAAVFDAPRNDLRFYIRPASGMRPLSRQFALLRTLATVEDQERIAALQSLYEAKLDLDTHYTLQRALRTWLYIHVPPSIALLALVTIHIVVVFSY
ncbi:MAG TPA: hypothetical protein VFP10_07685 [Candidatus Eisenbacteria bacterium]|nr:hypothetical protein [Candidatus Eisenbacteria bacterium]